MPFRSPLARLAIVIAPFALVRAQAASGASDCNHNGIPDSTDISNGTSQDCNANAIPDECDLASGTSADSNGNGVPDECECVFATYCQAAPNSVGFGSLMAHAGSASIASNDLELIAVHLPAGQSALFCYGPRQLRQPFGNGFRCVGGGVFRLPVVTVEPSGIARFALDYDQPPAPSGRIEAGETWNFQLCYRDPAAGGARFNLSNGLSITFCP